MSKGCAVEDILRSSYARQGRIAGQATGWKPRGCARSPGIGAFGGEAGSRSEPGLGAIPPQRSHGSASDREPGCSPNFEMAPYWLPTADPTGPFPIEWTGDPSWGRFPFRTRSLATSMKTNSGVRPLGRAYNSSPGIGGTSATTTPTLRRAQSAQPSRSCRNYSNQPPEISESRAGQMPLVNGPHRVLLFKRGR